MFYISLKWKVILISSCLMAALFSIRLMNSLEFFKNSFAQERTESFSQNYRTANNIINQLYSELQRLAATTTAVEGMPKALLSQKPDVIQKAFEGYWFQLQLENDISMVAIFSPQGKKLATWGEEEYPADIVQQVVENAAPSWAIRCADNCFIYAAVSMMIEGTDVGVVLYSMPLSAFVVSYAEITSSQSGIILEDRKNREDISKSEIIALNDRENNLPVVKMALNTNNLSNLLNSPRQIENNGRYYDVSAMDIPDKLSKRRGYLIFVNDITDKVTANHALIKSNYQFEMVAFALMEVSLFLLLLAPLNRIRMATSYMPLLAKNAYSEVRESLGKKSRSFGIFDEADTLNRVAIELSEKLEALQNELEIRAQELEKNGLALRQERDFVTGLLDTARALILTHDASGKIKLINEYGCWISGHKEQDLIGHSFAELFPPGELSDEILHNLHALSLGERSSYQHETPLLCMGGDILYMAWYHSSLQIPDTQNYDILTVALDISERKKAEDHLGWLASHDALTSLFNRRRFSEELERLLVMAQRYKHTGAVIFFDVDHFKEVNDTCGHHIGDLLLKRIAETVTQIIRDSDIFARFGGDEFALILSESSLNDATLVAQRICEAIANIPIAYDGKQLHVSASVGVTLFPEQGITLTELMSNADMAMYNVKKGGRNGWRVFDPAMTSPSAAA